MKDIIDILLFGLVAYLGSIIALEITAWIIKYFITGE